MPFAVSALARLVHGRARDEKLALALHVLHVNSLFFTLLTTCARTERRLSLYTKADLPAGHGGLLQATDLSTLFS